MTKDLLIKVLLGIVSTVLTLGMIYLFKTVDQNKMAISKIADNNKSEQAQWKAITELRKYHMN